VPLDRPPRPPAGAVTARVRRSILVAADRFGIKPIVLLGLHCEAEQIGSPPDLLEDVEERYKLPFGSLSAEVTTRIRKATGFSYSPADRDQIFADHGAQFILLALPDTEFLMVLEHAVGDSPPLYVASTPAARLLASADKALQAHGCAYRLDDGDWPHFAWVGDPAQRALTVQPALVALGDPRLDGPRGEFEEALRKRRRGAAKDLEDAIDEAAKSVESVLQILHDEHSVARTGKEAVQALFIALTKATILPSYVSSLVTAAAGPRNAMAAHGQGATVREVPEELADASIAAAATAITFLAHYLP
jgi:hypothetical protein